LLSECYVTDRPVGSYTTEFYDPSIKL